MQTRYSFLVTTYKFKLLGTEENQNQENRISSMTKDKYFWEGQRECYLLVLVTCTYLEFMPMIWGGQSECYLLIMVTCTYIEFM